MKHIIYEKIYATKQIAIIDTGGPQARVYMAKDRYPTGPAFDVVNLWDFVEHRRVDEKEVAERINRRLFA